MLSPTSYLEIPFGILKLFLPQVELLGKEHDKIGHGENPYYHKNSRKPGYVTFHIVYIELKEGVWGVLGIWGYEKLI